jgi:hypothetical protein
MFVNLFLYQILEDSKRFFYSKSILALWEGRIVAVFEGHILDTEKCSFEIQQSDLEQ